MATAAILGTGYIAESHALALEKLGVKITAALSRSEASAKAFAERHGIPGTSPELLDKADCVHVCTPPAAHYEAVKALLEKGKHVVCEKPLCVTAEQAAELAQLAEKTGAVCAVDFNMRYHPAVRRAKELIASPEFGRVLLVHGSYLQEFGASPAFDGWRYDPSLAGPMHAVTEIGSHWMDLAEYLTGRRIRSVSAVFDRFSPARREENGLLWPDENGTRRVESEDAALLTFRFDGGCIGSTVLSELSHGHRNDCRIEITGEHRTLWWSSENSGVLHHAEKGQPVITETFPACADFSETVLPLLRGVYADMENGTRNGGYPTFADGARNAALCGMAFASASRCN